MKKKITILGEKETHKYLGMLEVDNIKKENADQCRRPTAALK